MQVIGHGIGDKSGFPSKCAGQGAGAVGRLECNRPVSKGKYARRNWVWFISAGRIREVAAEREAIPDVGVGHTINHWRDGGARARRERLSRHERDQVVQARNFCEYAGCRAQEVAAFQVVETR